MTQVVVNAVSVVVFAIVFPPGMDVFTHFLLEMPKDDVAVSVYPPDALPSATWP